MTTVIIYHKTPPYLWRKCPHCGNPVDPDRSIKGMHPRCWREVSVRAITQRSRDALDAHLPKEEG